MNKNWNNFANFIKIKNLQNTQLVVDEPMFQPYPSEVFFQKYEPFQTYEVPLLLRNNDKVPRLVKVTQADTPYFKIITSGDAHQKVGPGLPVIYKIVFLPEENKDYSHEVIVTTEREKFIVPIRCIGSRAILDFPDEINFSLQPVKYLSSKVGCCGRIETRETFILCVWSNLFIFLFFLCGIAL